MELETLCGGVMDLAKEVGDFILNERKIFSSSSVVTKGKQNFVTHVDKASEELLVEA